MKQRITCFCENAFEVDIPDEIDLDGGTWLEDIQNGTFLNFTCTSCSKNLKPEFQLSITWPTKQLKFEVFPELDRGEFYRRKKTPASKDPYKLETIIGYPEMADRLAMIKDGFEPVAIEAIKYYLHLKADEQYPDDELDIWYYGSSESSLEFHIHGIRENEVAVMKVPISLYQKTLNDFEKNPKSELFSALRVQSYLSVKNTMRPDQFR